MKRDENMLMSYNKVWSEMNRSKTKRSRMNRPKYLSDCCKQIVNIVEGDHGIVGAHINGYDTTLELIHLVAQVAMKDLRHAASLQHGIDPNVFIAHRMALYFTAWYSWGDADRDENGRQDYWHAHTIFIRDLKNAIRSGEKLVRPIMQLRNNKILCRNRSYKS